MSGSWTDIKPKLHEKTLHTLSEHFGFSSPTPVQEQVIPLLLSYKDVSVEACTGSGKTLAFAIPIFEILRKAKPENKVGALIIAPVRELALQVKSVFDVFLAEYSEISVSVTIGGTPIMTDVDMIKNECPNVLVATPGRLVDILSRIPDTHFLGELEVFVMDEADRLLQMGFMSQIGRILEQLPRDRRTSYGIGKALYSATQSEATDQLSKVGLRNPVNVSISVKGGDLDQRTPMSLLNYYHKCQENEKLSRLLNFLVAHKEKKIVVFFLTCASVDYWEKVGNTLTESLSNHISWKAAEFAGSRGKCRCTHFEGEEYSPYHNETIERFEDFLSQEKGVLFTTDLAARGLDIPFVHWIIQYDAPQKPETYLHRVGRTARMGQDGSSLLFITEAESTYIEFLELRHIPLSEFQWCYSSPELEPEALRERIVSLMKENSNLQELAIVAFVSFVRAYKEHSCKYIFILNEVDIGRLANCYGLLQLPSMPEVRDKRISTDNFIRTEGLQPKKKKTWEMSHSGEISCPTATNDVKERRGNRYRGRKRSWSKQKAKLDRKKMRKSKKEQEFIEKLERIKREVEEENEINEDYSNMKRRREDQQEEI